MPPPRTTIPALGLLLGVPALPLALLLAPSPAMALDIKGLEVDKPVNCAQINALEIRSGSFAPACENGLDRWYKEVSFLGGKASMTLMQSPERILLRVLVLGFKFDEALDALTLKWGAPHIETSVIQNRAGASFEQVEAIWNDGSITLRLERHGSRIDNPTLSLIGAEAIKAMRKESAEKARRNQGNL